MCIIYGYSIDMFLQALRKQYMKSLKNNAIYKKMTQMWQIQNEKDMANNEWQINQWLKMTKP